ncbi:MAG TPA: hypothetical protein VGH38_05555 [Bryobacteraceae bacterium]
MSRKSLKYLAVFLGVLIVVVLFAGFDDIPRQLRSQVDAERTALAAAQTQLRSAQDEVLRNLQTEAELFHAIPSSQQWPEQLSKDLGDLQLAGHQMEQLTALQKQNRRGDKAQVEQLLAQERAVRTAALAQAGDIQKQAKHWVEAKQHLPELIQQMERDYGTIHNFDLAPLTATVQKAESDWPDKQADLDARLKKVQGMVDESETLWRTTYAARRQAAAGDLAHLDFAALIGAADSLKTSAAALPTESEQVKSLSAQLYNAYDKVLIDMETRGGEYQQNLRTVTTHLADANAKSGEISSAEKWVVVPKATYEAEKNDLGMAVEHKAAGKYDVEAERVAQPAGFAYVAPPGQGSNQYGYWDHRDGRDFWVFYGQYALLRDLLFNHQYQPIDRYDWEGYRTYQSRRETYYGRSAGSSDSAPRYGTQGTSTQERYSGSKYAKGGGFRDSKYGTKSGSYSDSKYASPGGDRSPKKFGSGGRPEEPHRASPPTSRPSPRPSYRPPSAPRRFGKR